MNLYEIIKLSLKSLSSFKIRSFLTMLGIIVGISSVILISSIGEGFKDGLLGDTTKSFSQMLIISIDSDKLRGDSLKRDYYFTNSDIKKIENIDNVEKSFFYNQSAGELLNSKERIFFRANAVGKGGDKRFVPKLYLGRYFTDEEISSGSNVAILDYYGAVNIFGSPEKAIGKQIKINFFREGIKTFTIRGVESKPDSELLSQITKASTITIPDNILSKGIYKKVLLVKTKDLKNINKTVNLIKEYLKIKSSNKDIYTVELINDQLKEITGILNKISLFISFIAGVSLMVGGIGVMNIMLVSVTERISEIGLRKAIGAKNKDILLQFLIESIILTLIGGIIGVFLGYSLATLIGIFIKVIPVLKLKVLIINLSISITVGLIFGIYPARKASRLSPMEALRTE